MKTQKLVTPFQRCTRASAAILAAGALTLGLYADDSASSSSRSTTGTAGSSDTTRQSESSSLKRGEKKFIKEVAKSSSKEVALAQLAVQRASNPQIKEYARQIISDHQQMSQDLMGIARDKNVEIAPLHAMTTSPGSMTSARTETAAARSEAASQSATASTSGAARGTGTAGTDTASLPEEITSDRDYRRLADKSGEEFDREFVEVMTKAHEKDLKMFQQQAEKADDSAVRQFASSHTNVLQGHLDRAETLSQSVAE